MQNLNEQCIPSSLSSFLKLDEFSSLNYRTYVLICNICLHGIEWFNFKFMSIAKNIYNLDKTNIFSHYMLINYGLCNYSNLYRSNFIQNLHIVFTSIRSHISLYLDQESKYLKNQIDDWYWILKKKYKLLIYDIYWSVKLNKQIYNNFIYECKNFLYKKDLLKRLRLNNHAQLRKIIQQLFNLITIFFKYFNAFISFTIVQKIYKLFSNILYFWYKKKYKRTLKLQLHNHWNRVLFINLIINIRINLLYITFLKQINR
uniref:Reverse transcriptase N-terminal domain-containing protein n=1 Tax=Gracilaria gracilis TaxID=2777 RepID=A0A345U7R3_GRAGA|nr:hypothetical protein [Gracilaria gracilis]AXI96499.1 hypothetical protein [Gracilaria gracilis]